jgi:hypothetical protein
LAIATTTVDQTAAAMLAYLRDFLSGTADPFWPHVILLSVSVLASFAVGAGIIFESPKYSDFVHRVAVGLVIAGVVVEAACTIFLFVFDEGISGTQQSKIIVLETRLAPRTLPDPEVAEIVAKLKQFGGQEFTIGTFDGEAASLARRLRVVLEKADWKWFDPANQMMPLAGTIGIQVWAWSQGSRNAAGPLVDALNGKAIEAKLLPADRGPPAVDDSKQIEIIVGSKF